MEGFRCTRPTRSAAFMSLRQPTRPMFTRGFFVYHGAVLLLLCCVTHVTMRWMSFLRVSSWKATAGTLLTNKASSAGVIVLDSEKLVREDSREIKAREKVGSQRGMAKCPRVVRARQICVLLLCVAWRGVARRGAARGDPAQQPIRTHRTKDRTPRQHTAPPPDTTHTLTHCAHARTAHMHSHLFIPTQTVLSMTRGKLPFKLLTYQRPHRSQRICVVYIAGTHPTRA